MDEKPKGSDPTKGPKFKAVTNVSFGKLRPTVMAGQVFQLDDADLAKELLASGSITKDLSFVDESKAGEPTQTDSSKPGPNVSQNAAELRGKAADDAADEAETGKSKAAKK
jgi:hypothetical protein